jgi:hypothetical protein
MKTCNKSGHQYDDNMKQCPFCKAESNKLWREINKEHLVQARREWYVKNKEYVVDRKRGYQKRRRDEDLLYKMSGNIRKLIGNSFTRQGWAKSTKTQLVLGCDFPTLQAHLIQTALKNYGYWADFQDYHIDHIVPISTATTQEELLKLNHYTNLQLLYPEHNLSKRNKLDWKITNGP